MKLSPRTESLLLFVFASLISVTTATAALGVDPFVSSAPLKQTIAKVTH